MSKKINLMIVGAHKSGTTSLKNYLNEHPDILGHVQRDMKFFMNEEEYSKGFEAIFDKYMNVGDVDNAKCIVAKDAGTYLLESNLKRIKDHNHECKIVFLIRNPVNRAYSHYKFELGKGYYHDLDFERILKFEDYSESEGKFFNHVLKLGKYSVHYKTMLELFDKTNIKVILFEDLKENPEKVCKDIFSWIGVDSSFEPNTNKVHNLSKKPKYKWYSEILGKIRNADILLSWFKFIFPARFYKKTVDWIHSLNSGGDSFEPLKEEVKNGLTKYYKDYNVEMEELAKIDLKNWK
ncbi:sulfotransferase domain-containing protein [Lutimonas saemankumensis]|uniref:sulfotransferase domain-containing protein n=1 Tax=Lutimonas saemankumensis TaxID=483016 RepID=UPI001CD53FB3|nr:sulfotransferase domain-containing protein [Lutimonas saemankumensis]MCA0931070.1 sulfotransferase domain-containing protein [Lutimonas saemankumensis]